MRGDLSYKRKSIW